MFGNNSRCWLCKTDGTLKPLVKGFDRVEARAQAFAYVKCGCCGLVSLDPLPDSSEINGFYPQNYEPHFKFHGLNRRKAINRFAIKHFYAAKSVNESKILRRLLRICSSLIMRNLLEPHGSCRLLDVGCGAGEMLENHRALGWKVAGIDSNPRAVAVCQARGLEVHLGNVFDAPYAGRVFDVILLSHVIEHVLEPDAVLRRTAGWLVPGGKIVMLTPNAGSILFLLFGSCWFALDAPRHIFLFNRRSLRLLAAAAGLTMKRLVCRSEAQVLSESLHYLRTQGREMPEGLDQRRTMIETSTHVSKQYRALQKIAGLPLALAALVGKGDLLTAELGLLP